MVMDGFQPLVESILHVVLACKVISDCASLFCNRLIQSEHSSYSYLVDEKCWI